MKRNWAEGVLALVGIKELTEFPPKLLLILFLTCMGSAIALMILASWLDKHNNKY